MMPLATANQMKALDRIAIEERGIPSLTLMERAATAVAEAVQALVSDNCGGSGEGPVAVFLPRDIITQEQEAQAQAIQAIFAEQDRDRKPRVAVLCGPGNNGGDGIAAARLLLERGYTVRTFLVGNRAKMTPDARVMEEKLIAVGGTLENFLPDSNLLMAWLITCDCVVDALFGIGLKRPVTGDFLAAIQMMNRGRAPVVACDIPSGVDADTGAVLGECVEAKVTVTFTCGKPGLYLGQGSAYAGAVSVADIGIPHPLIHTHISGASQPVQALQPWDCTLPRRPLTGHKGDFGKVFILAGSEGYTGAPVLCADGAVRMGAGLVFLGVPREIYPIVAVKCNEAMPFPIPSEYDQLLAKASACDVAVIGPGLGREAEVQALVRRLLSDLNIPVVLDADGINALAGHINILDKRSAPTVLTPHDGEFQRLTGCTLPLENRLEAARAFAVAHNCTLVLKGHGTVTATWAGETWVNLTGNPGMAKGGSGDVLAGMIAALLGQHHLWERTPGSSKLAAMGVCLHGMAGDVCAKKLGEYAMTPTDLVAALPEVLLSQQGR